MKERTQLFVDAFFRRHPDLVCIRDNILKAGQLWTDVLGNGGKILLCGNGGSCADCDHIAGELLKGFLLKRPMSEEFILLPVFQSQSKIWQVNSFLY